MRRQWLLGIAVMVLGTSSLGAQEVFDPDHPGAVVKLLAPRDLGAKNETPVNPVKPAVYEVSVVVPEAPSPPKLLPQSTVAPAVYQPAPWPNAGNAQAACQVCEPACPPRTAIWVDADYLMWWMRSGAVPVLITASPLASAGIAGQPGTIALAGGSNINLGAFSGLRVTAGAWLDEFQTVGIEGSWLTFWSRSYSYFAGNNGAPGAPVVARPFFNAISNSEDSELVAASGILGGGVLANVSTRLDGWEVNSVWNVCCCCDQRIDLLVGFRSLALNDGLTVLEDLTVLPDVPGLGGNRYQVADEFHARSTLYAGQLGARMLWQHGNWDAQLTGKVALGTTHEEVSINGFTALTPAGGATTVLPGGLLALPSNIGNYSRDAFTVAPEASLRLGCQLTEMIHLGVGYSFLYWSDVVRVGDQVDRVLSPNQLPALQVTGVNTAGSRPAFAFHDTDFWAQGVNVSLEFRY